jgi:hypothetical protein
MNNPLAQKYNYYLNESYRLSEELKTEESYSELLENVLFELLGEEDFTKLFEYVMRGTVTHDENGNALSKERSARRAKRIGQIVDIGRKAAAKINDNPAFNLNGTANSASNAAFNLVGRATDSLIAKGATADEKENSRGNNVFKALETGGKIKIQQDSPIRDYTDTRQAKDLDQKRGSLLRRNKIKRQRDDAANTF